MSLKLHQKLLAQVIDHEKIMLERIISWSNIPSGSNYPDGLGKMQTALIRAFAPLQASLEIFPYPASGAAALLFSKRLDAPTTILLGGHYDTVYGDTINPPEQISATVLQGSGVTDMKGGIALLLSALEIFESSPATDKLGWQVLLTFDEEIGSPATTPLWRELSQRHPYALLFEPAHADGSWVDERKGSINLSVHVKGCPAHSGRDFSTGRSAVYSLARVITGAEDLNRRYEGISVNVGTVEGGTATNIVPDKAVCTINLRSFAQHDLDQAMEDLRAIVDKASEEEGITAELFVTSKRPAKKMSPKLQHLFSLLQSCAEDLDIPFQTKSSGGCCDGNDIAAAGGTVIDTMGVIGGKIHTPDEYLDITSLIPRCQCALLLMLKIADRGIPHA